MSCYDGILCYKFIIMAIISLSCVAFSCVMLAIDRFKNVPLSTFCTSLLTAIMGFWMDAPKPKGAPVEKKDEGPPL